MSKGDDQTTIQELKDLVIKFGSDRHWARHHTPKNLAVSIAIEAAELMEHYQWEVQGEPDQDEVASELADVLFYLLNFAHVTDIDIADSFQKKYDKLLKKYPVEKFNQNGDLTEYRKVKKTYRNKK